MLSNAILTAKTQTSRGGLKAMELLTKGLFDSANEGR